MDKKIMKKDSSGRIYLQEGITVAFFLKTPMHEIVAPLLAAFEEYLKIIPANILRWESVGATSEEWKPINETTIKRCRAQLKFEAVRKRKITAFELAGGDKGGEAQEYGIIIIGNPIDPEIPNELNLIQMYFPIEIIKKDNVKQFIENISRLAALLPYVSGYASPGLHWSELGFFEALSHIRSIVARYPGYDFQMNETGRTRLGLRVRGARWLNFLGPEIIEKLGGIDKIKGSLSEQITIKNIGHGVMIQAGDIPEIGDVNKQIGTPLLCSVAKTLEPVTAFDEIVLLGSYADWDNEILKKWERRFLD